MRRPPPSGNIGRVSGPDWSPEPGIFDKLNILRSFAGITLESPSQEEPMSIHPVMQRLADRLKRTDLPAFVPGDQVRVQVKIKEGDKERLQAFEGLVIAINKGPQGTFTVRKMSFGQGVERIFPFNSKVVDKVERLAQLQSASGQAVPTCGGSRGKAARLREVDRVTGPKTPKPQNPKTPKPLYLYQQYKLLFESLLKIVNLLKILY